MMLLNGFLRHFKVDQNVIRKTDTHTHTYRQRERERERGRNIYMCVCVFERERQRERERERESVCVCVSINSDRKDRIRHMKINWRKKEETERLKVIRRRQK